MRKHWLAFALFLWPLFVNATSYQPVLSASVLEACSQYQSSERAIDNYLCQGFQLLSIKKNLPRWLERIFGKDEGRQLAKAIFNDESWKETVAEMEAEANDNKLPLFERAKKKTQLKAMMLERAFAFATALLPEQRYSQSVIEACSDEGHSDDENKCLESMLQFNRHKLEATYHELVKRRGFFSGLVGEHKAWLVDMEYACNFNKAFGDATQSAEMQCKIGWMRLRESELAEELKAETK